MEGGRRGPSCGGLREYTRSEIDVSVFGLGGMWTKSLGIVHKNIIHRWQKYSHPKKKKTVLGYDIVEQEILV